MSIEKVAVIGAGQMGRGIAQVFATAGKDVTIVDINDAIIANSEAALDKGFTKMISRGKMTEEQVAGLKSRMHFVAATEYAGILDNTDLVVEAAVERVDLKKSIFKKLDEATQGRVHPGHQHLLHLHHRDRFRRQEQADKVIGMHFFNPACGHEAG